MLIEEVLPLIGTLIQGTLDMVAHLKLKKLQLSCLNLVMLLMDSRDGMYMYDDCKPLTIPIFTFGEICRAKFESDILTT